MIRCIRVFLIGYEDITLSQGKIQRIEGMTCNRGPKQIQTKDIAVRLLSV